MIIVLQTLRCPPVLIHSVEDHIHVLIELVRTVALNSAVDEIKKASSKWIRTQGAEFAGCAWQAGYGAFAVSESSMGPFKNKFLFCWRLFGLLARHERGACPKWPVTSEKRSQQAK